MKLTTIILLLALGGASISRGAIAAEAPAQTKQTLPADPDKAWKQLETASKTPPVPEWGDKTPTQEQKEKFQKQLGDRSAEVAAQAREFYTRFPDHPKAAEAKEKEQRFVQQALAYGNESVKDQADSALTDDQKLEQKVNELQKRAMKKRAEGLPAFLKEMETGIRDLMKEYPKSPDLWAIMLQISQYSDKDNSKRILKDIVASTVADPEVVDRAKGVLKQVDALGQPLEISFTAVDGRKIDVQKMKGKVVMIDFWASWCGPCMASLPEVLDIYSRYHDKGFEIVGISLDKTRPPFDAVLKKNNMTWPQYYDGKGWANKFALEYGVGAIPAVWLVDKAGLLRTTEGREDLEKQIKNLLAEKI